MIIKILEEEEEKNNNNNNEIIYYNKYDNYPNKESENKHKHKNENYHNNKEEHHNNNLKLEKDVDYSFLFSFYLNIIKKFIKEKIISEKIKEKLVSLPKETIYQIIVMIDKFESNQKLIELTYLNNFGIDLNIHKQLKSIIQSSSQENETHFKNILKNLELKKLLIIYKYLFICSKKVDNLFYRLDFEQIDEDLYEDFVQRETKEDEKTDKKEKEKRFLQSQLKKELNFGFKLYPEDKKVTEIDSNKNKKSKEKKEESPSSKQKSKLDMLLNDEFDENKESNNKNNNKKKGKKKKGKYVEFNINDFDLEKDFPKLK